MEATTKANRQDSCFNANLRDMAWGQSEGVGRLLPLRIAECRLVL